MRQTRFVTIDSSDRLQDVCGPEHRHLHCLEKSLTDYCVTAESQGGAIRVEGIDPGPEMAERALCTFSERIAAGAEANSVEFEGIIRLMRGSERGSRDILVADSERIFKGLRRPVSPRSAGQYAYAGALMDTSLALIFGIGAAGTGKTYLAVAAGISSVLSGRAERFIIARPAVEAGEKLGFLPGDMEDKVDPFMLPIRDCLYDILGSEEAERRKARGQIEIAPLAFMRGRTIDNAFILVDEAQNATHAQMKMVLTRLGRGGRMVVVGDPSQSDLDRKDMSGLDEAVRRLDGVEGVRIIRLTEADIVRHDLVARIVRAYDGASP